jgi:hypothetical protein
MEKLKTYTELTHNDLSAATVMACWYTSRSEAYIVNHPPRSDRDDNYHGVDGKLYFRSRRKTIQASNKDYDPLNWGLDIHLPFLK